MVLARVRGQAVASAKVTNLEGHKLLLVELLTTTPEGLQNTLKHMVCVDQVGAGDGEIVLVVQGSSARVSPGMREVATDAVIVGIADSVTAYSKAAARAGEAVAT